MLVRVLGQAVGVVVVVVVPGAAVAVPGIEAEAGLDTCLRNGSVRRHALEQHVERLDVGVQHAHRVHELQRDEDLPRNVQHDLGPLQQRGG